MAKTKDRLLSAGEKLFSRQGYSGTGLKQLAKEAHAPWSSMYHFFPGGKEQLAGEVIRYAGDMYAGMIRRSFEVYSDPVEAIDAMFAAEIKILEQSNFRHGCPIASVTLDIASTVEKLRKPCGEVFAAWIDALAAGIAGAGVAEDTALDLATYALSALEGAIVLSRSTKSVAPLQRTSRFVHQTLVSASKTRKKMPLAV